MFIYMYVYKPCIMHTFSFAEEVDPFWLCGEEVLSEPESLAIGLHGGDDIGISDKFVSQLLLSICLDATGTICLGVDGIVFWILFGGIIVRLFGFLHPYCMEQITLCISNMHPLHSYIINKHVKTCTWLLWPI